MTSVLPFDWMQSCAATDPLAMRLAEDGAGGRKPYAGATEIEILALAEEVGPIASCAANGEAKPSNMAAPAIRRTRRQLASKVNLPEKRGRITGKPFCVMLTHLGRISQPNLAI